MKKVLIYSVLLIVGMLGSQFLPVGGTTSFAIKLLTMTALSFIMVHVGFEFEIDRTRLRSYGFDAAIAMSAACLPWLFCAAYFLFVLTPPDLRGDRHAIQGAFLEGLFAAPTSAGVLFSMLAAAGLAATWLFQKARVLAIFDDLGTLLLLLPLKAMIIGLRWQLGIIVAIMLLLLWIAWRWMRTVPLPITWPFVLCYAALITGFSEVVYESSKWVDKTVPIHLEVLLPAFVLGCLLKRPAGDDPHPHDAIEGHGSAGERRAATIVSATFMVLVGLSLPPIFTSTPDSAPPNWAMIAVHVLAITLLSNLGKLVPAFCYRKEATLRERLALAVGMFPRGEVGAGVLVIGVSFGITGVTLTVAVLSLALNLLATGLFIVVVKRLLGATGSRA